MRVFRKTLDVLSSALLVLFILFAVLLVGVRIVGIEPHVVLSGSMEPEILTGSLVYVSPVSPEEAQNLKVGDTVTYVVDQRGTKVTHKIYEVVGPAYVKNQYGEIMTDASGAPLVAKDSRGNPIVMYTTYGINNKNSADPSGYTLDGKPGVGNLASSNVFGKTVFTIPFLGYVAHFLQNPPGMYVAILICAFLIVNTFWGAFSKKESDAEPAKDSTAGEHDAEILGEGENDSQIKQE